MKVILLQDVKALGKKGEVVNVNDGYASNFILPKKLGVEANGKNLNDLKLQKNNEAKVAQEHLDAAKKLAEELKAGKVVLTMKVGEGEEHSVLFPARRLQRQSKSRCIWILIKRRFS